MFKPKTKLKIITVIRAETNDMKLHCWICQQEISALSVAEIAVHAWKYHQPEILNWEKTWRLSSAVHPPALKATCESALLANEG